MSLPSAASSFSETRLPLFLLAAAGAADSLLLVLGVDRAAPTPSYLPENVVFILRGCMRPDSPATRLMLSDGEQRVNPRAYVAGYLQTRFRESVSHLIVNIGLG